MSTTSHPASEQPLPSSLSLVDGTGESETSRLPYECLVHLASPLGDPFTPFSPSIIGVARVPRLTSQRSIQLTYIPHAVPTTLHEGGAATAAGAGANAGTGSNDTVVGNSSATPGTP